MSSIVKKPAKFLKNLKKNVTKRKLPVAPTMTPPPSQSQSQTTVIPDSSQTQPHDSMLATPKSTQVEDSTQPSFEFTKKSTHNDDTVDPMDSSQAISHPVGSDNEIEHNSSDHDLDTDIFKLPTESQRRSSSIPQRRLSGITPIGIRNRSASIISASSSAQPEGSESTAKPPAKIGIPAGKTTKRRRSSAARINSKKTTIVKLAEPSDVIEESPETNRDIEEDNDSEFVVAIDPKTNRLRKYKRKTIEGMKEVESDSEAVIERKPKAKPKTKPKAKAKAKVKKEKADETKKSTKTKRKLSESNEAPSEKRRRLRAYLRSRQAGKSYDGTDIDSEKVTENENEKQKEAEQKDAEQEEEHHSAEEMEEEEEVIVEESEDEKEVKKKPKSKKPKAKPDLSNRKIIDSSQLPKKVEDEDAILFESITVDDSKFTISDLCKPTFLIGKLSTNFQQVQDAAKKMKLEKEKRKQDRKMARTQRIPLEKIIAQNTDPEEEDKKKKPNSLLDVDDEPAPSGTSVQVKIDSTGKMIVDQDSLARDRHSNIDRSNRVVEESNPYENPVISTTYGKRRYTDRWTNEESAQFYAALSTFGTDFTMIAQLFPYRNRKQVKSKFNLDEKKYPEIIEMALKRKLPADFEKYCRDSGNKIETLEYYNKQLEQVRIDHEKNLSQIEEEKQKAAREDAEASRKREIEIRTGIKPMSRAEKLRELRKNEMVVGSIDDMKKQKLEEEA